MPTGQLAFCATCEGVLEFHEIPYKASFRIGALALAIVREGGLECHRCGTAYAPVDPAAGDRRGALRHLLYAGVSIGAALSLDMADAVFDGGRHTAWGETAAGGALGLLSLVCLFRSLWLWTASARYERLNSWEVKELGRRLCPGMVRSDVVDELASRGWRIGKIRSVLESLKPCRRRAA